MKKTIASNLSQYSFVFKGVPLLALFAGAAGLASPASAQSRVSSGSACVSRLVSAPIVEPNTTDPYITAYRTMGKIRAEDSHRRGGLVYTCPVLRTSIAKKVSNIVVRHSLGAAIEGTQRITCSLIKQATPGQGFSTVTTLESTVISGGTDMVFPGTVNGGSRISLALECDLGSYSEILSYRWKEG